MTVSSAVAKSGPYTGADDFVFAYNFRVFADAEIQVTTVVIATGVEEILTLTTDYTVQDAGDATGTITLTAGTFPTGLPSTKKLVVSRDMGFLQEIDFENQGGFFPDTHEDGFDRLKMEIQQVKEEVGRSVKVDITGTTTPDDLLDDIADSVAAASASAAAAATSESNAATSETNADADATATAADAVSTAADAAATAADAIATAADAVSTAADAAATAADEANTDADAIATAADAVSTAADAVSTAADAAATEAALDEFTDLYLGSHASDPTLDNDGDALADGALYWNTTSKIKKTYNLSDTTWYATVTAAVEATNPNLIINGGMDIWQREVSFAAHGGGFSADRWSYGESSAGVIAITKEADSLSGIGSCLQVEVTTADAAVAAADYSALFTSIEGIDVQHLLAGTAGAKAVTLSFDVRSAETGIHCVSFRNAATDRTYIVEYTVDVADTWEHKTVTLTLDTSGTWLVDASAGLTLLFTMMAGTDHHGTADTWAAGAEFATVNQVNVLGTINNEFAIDNVKLEEGSVETPFVPRSIAEELALCQRYYEQTYEAGVYPGASDEDGKVAIYISNIANFQHQCFIHCTFKVRKRAAPTVEVYSPANGVANRARDYVAGANVTPSSVGSSATSLRVTATGASSTALSLGVHWTADAEL